jgi:hypothetical protein
MGRRLLLALVLVCVILVLVSVFDGQDTLSWFDSPLTS